MRMDKYKAQRFFHEVFMTAGNIVAGRKVYYAHTEDGPKLHGYQGRAWFKRESLRRLHPAIEKVIVGYCYRPRDWHQLLLEWPHRSETDPNRLAYTQSEIGRAHV